MTAPSSDRLRALWSSPTGLLARRLLLVLGVYAVVRLLFLAVHPRAFASVSAWSIAGAFVQGLRFDLSAIAYSNLPIVLLSFAPAAVRASLWYRRVLFALFVAVNGTLAMIMVADVAYYPFTGTRVTMEVVELTGEAANQAPQLLFNYAGYALLAIALTATLALLFPRDARTAATPTTPSPRARVRRVASAVGVLLLTILAARGGWQKKPLKPIHAFTSGHHELGILTLNSAFTLIHSPREQPLEPVQLFADARDAEELLTGTYGYANSTAEGFPRRQNVVLIVLESIGTEFWGAPDREVHLTPFLDSLAQHGVLYRDGFANGRRSMDALPSILLGMPLLMGRSLAVSRYQSNEWRGLGDFLGENGYATAMFHGAPKGTMFFDAIAGMAGIERFYPLEAFPDSVRRDAFDGHWGLFDEPALLWAAEEMSNLREPFFSLLFTISTHHPYQLPAEYEGVFPPGEKDLHASVQYLDLAVRRFFERAQQEPWYENTLFILTGDHTAPDRSERFDTALGRYLVPIFLFHPRGKLPRLDADRIVQHVDLFPTILDYTGSEAGRVPRFGRSLFGPSTGEAVVQSNEIFWLVRRDAVLERDPTGREELFAFLGERTGEAPADSDSLLADRRRRLDAYIQHFTTSMIGNSFYRAPEERATVRAAPSAASTPSAASPPAASP